jgi:hypothetical protein
LWAADPRSVAGCVYCSVGAQDTIDNAYQTGQRAMVVMLPMVAATRTS